MIDSIALVILVICILAAGFSVFFAAFDTLIILLGAIVYAVMTRFTILQTPTLGILVFLYIIGEVFEYLCIAVGAKKFGASGKAAIGAVIGGILGSIIGISIAGIGALPGLFLGIFLGAFLTDFFLKRDVIKALKAGAGGVIGRMSLIVIKMILICIMTIVLLMPILRHYYPTR